MRLLLPFSLLIGLCNFLISWYLLELDKCVLNKGIAFGIDIEYEVGISVLILLILIYSGIRLKNIFRYLILSIAILGISHLIVRVIFGSICDYILFLNIHFNIVDICIVVISILSIYLVMKNQGK